MNRTKNIALSRLKKDLQEIMKEPQNGIGIGIYDNDPFKYLVNMKLLNGDYSGLCLQLSLFFPDTYPINPPTITLMPNQGFDNKFHHHIYGTGFCFDLLANRYLSVKDKQTGWTSCYTLSSLLLQVQIFLSIPDFPPGIKPPTKEEIANLFNRQKEYQISFKSDEDEYIVHTWADPYPKMYEIALELQTKTESEPEIVSNKPTVFYNEATELKENLTCSVLKTSFIEDHNVTLGYPIIKCDKSFYPIPEMLSYEAYINHIQNEEQKLDHYFNIKYKSSMGEFYNCWFPIYINNTHFEKNKETILNALTIIVNGASGKKKYDFKPQYIINVFPRLLNTMIMGLFQNTTIISDAFLCCYFHFVLLFKKLMSLYAKDINTHDYLTPAIKLIEQFNNSKTRKTVSLIVEDSLMLLLFSEKKHKEKAEKFFLRHLIKENIMQVREKGSQTKQKLIDIIANQKSMQFFDKNKACSLEEDFFKNDFKHWSELFEILKEDYHLKSTFQMNKGNELGSLSKKVSKDPNIVQVDLYDDFDFFSAAKEEEDNNNDEPIEYTDYNDYVDFYNEIKGKFIVDQHRTLALCTEERRQRVYTLLQQNYSMGKYVKGFDQDQVINSLHSLTFNSLLEMCNKCSSEQFMNYVYSQNPRNHILLIIYITKLYFSDASFMRTLEDNYGVLLQNQLYKVKHELKEAQDSILNYTSLMIRIRCASYLNTEFDLYKEILNKQ